MQTTPTKDSGQMKVRLPVPLKEAIAKSAENNLRTLNAEIVHRLRETFQTHKEQAQ